MLNQNDYSAQKARHDHDEEVKENLENTCWNCAYKEDVPGSAHVKCMRAWSDVKPPKAKKTHWYVFPFNFDPIWQEEECNGWAKERDPKRTITLTPLGELLSIMISNR